MNVEIITTCMGRLRFLRDSLPSWLLYTPADVTLVDYDCPERSGHWAAACAGARDRLKTLWLTASEHDRGKPLFNKSRAINVALDSSSAEYVMLLDADTKIADPDFWWWLAPQLAPGSIFIAEPTAAARELAGFLVAPRALLQGLRFDEAMPGWAPHDLDLRIRLYLSKAPVVIEVPWELLHALPHGDELRAKNYAEPLGESFQWGMQRLARNAEILAGRPFDKIMDDPTVRRLLGA